MYKRLSPNVIFVSGQSLLCIPILAEYRLLEPNKYGPDALYEYISIHLYSVILFFLSSLFFSLTYNPKGEIVKISTARNVDSAVVVAFLGLILIQIYFFGGVPVLQLLNGSLTVSELNAANESSGGLLGVWLISSFMLAMIVPLTRSNNSYYISLIFVLFFINSLIQAKRQLIFYGVITYIVFRSDRIGRRKSILFMSFCVFIFSLIGSLRSNSNIIEPLLLYLYLPIENGLFVIDLVKEPLVGVGGILDAFVISLPSSIRSEVAGPVLPFPSAGSSMVSKLFYDSGLIGIGFYIVLLSVFTTYIFARGRTNDYYRVLYAFSAWPLFATSAYTHFSNLMFYWIPVLMFYLFYKILRKRRITTGTKGDSC